MRDIVSKHGTIVNAGPAANNNANANSAAILTQGYNGAMFYIIAGTWTNGTHTFTVAESNDPVTTSPGSVANFTATANSNLVLWQATSSSNYTPVKVGQSQPTNITSAATAINQRVGYIGSANWVQMQITANGASGAIYTVVCELGEPRFMPANV